MSSAKEGGTLDDLSEMLKGVLEGIVLEIIGRGEIYGYEINRRLRAMGFDGIAEASVYALLLRLEKNRLVHVTKRPSEIGPPRKFYTLNERGREELKRFWARWSFLSERVELLRKQGGNRHEFQQ